MTIMFGGYEFFGYYGWYFEPAQAVAAAAIVALTVSAGAALLLAYKRV